MSTGIIHAGFAGKDKWVRADIRLAPGNSGGPLADADGRVVGINSMVVNGLALAIPAHVVAGFLNRSFKIGVTLQPIATDFEGRPALGLMIVALEPGGIARLSGLLVSDIIVAANGQPFSEPTDLAKAIASAMPGRGLELTLLRGAAVVTCPVALTEEKAGQVA